MSHKDVPHAKILRKALKTLISGQIKEKRKFLERLKNEYTSPWDRGYILGIEFIINKPDKKFDNQIDLNEIPDEKTWKELKEFFEAMSKNRLLGGFDRGFFSSLEDYLLLRRKGWKYI